MYVGENFLVVSGKFVNVRLPDMRFFRKFGYRNLEIKYIFQRCNDRKRTLGRRWLAEVMGDGRP